MNHQDRYKLANHKRVSIRLDDFPPPPDESVRLVVKNGGVQIVMEHQEKGFRFYSYHLLLAFLVFKGLMLFILLIQIWRFDHILNVSLLISFALWCLVLIGVVYVFKLFRTVVVERVFLQTEDFVYTYSGFGWKSGQGNEKIPVTRYLKWRDDMGISRMVKFRKVLSRNVLTSLTLSLCVSGEKRLTLDLEEKRLVLAPIATAEVRQWLYEVLAIYGKQSLSLKSVTKHFNDAPAPRRFKIARSGDKISIVFFKRNLHKMEKGQVFINFAFLVLWVWFGYNSQRPYVSPTFLEVMVWCAVALFLMLNLTLYLIKASEKLIITKEQVRYTSGSQILFYSRIGWVRSYRTGQWVYKPFFKGLKQRFLGIRFDRAVLAKAKLLTTDYGNHLYIPFDDDLFEIGRNCTEIEREWLYDYLKSL